MKKLVARWTAYVAVTRKRKESARVIQILSIVAFTKLTNSLILWGSPFVARLTQREAHFEQRETMVAR